MDKFNNFTFNLFVAVVMSTYKMTVDIQPKIQHIKGAFWRSFIEIRSSIK